MRPSLVLFSKASRLPLNSKKGNKDFYKGTRTGNMMVRKRIAVANRNTGEQLYDKQGRERTWNLKTHRLDESRIASYIVPPGLTESKMRPLVWLGKRSEGGVDKIPKGGYPGGEKMKAGGNLDGDMYMRLRSEVLARQALFDDEQNR